MKKSEGSTQNLHIAKNAIFWLTNCSVDCLLFDGGIVAACIQFVWYLSIQLQNTLVFNVVPNCKTFVSAQSRLKTMHIHVYVLYMGIQNYFALCAKLSSH